MEKTKSANNYCAVIQSSLLVNCVFSSFSLPHAGDSNMSWNTSLKRLNEIVW